MCLPTLLSGCVTMGLWGFEWREAWDPATGEDEGGYVRVEGAWWEWWRVLLRVAATPLTLAADAGAAMVDDVLLGWIDDDGGGERGERMAGSPVPSAAPRRQGRSLLSGVRR